jgi:SAM-dependent methyltransferase
MSAAEANRVFYRDNADRYEEFEFCTFGELPQRHLRGLLRRALAEVGPPARVLDAGGGSGNASLALLERGLDPIVLDISPEMVARWEMKARALGHEPRSEVASLEEFFATDERDWDLIVFSSVLHHLEHPVEVLRAAASRLAPGGAIVTDFDPIAVDARNRFVRRLDYLLWGLRHSPGKVLRTVARRLRSLRDEASESPNVGALAEAHAMSGLDDFSIAEQMRSRGLEVVVHDRIPYARYAVLRRVLGWTRSPTIFAFVLRRPAG